MDRNEYAAYLRSDHWREFSSRLKEEVGQCEECGITDTLNVHHLHYRTIGNETRKDVKVFCERCHMNWHILANRMKMFGIVGGPFRGSFIEQRDYVMFEIAHRRQNGPLDVVRLGEGWGAGGKSSRGTNR